MDKFVKYLKKEISNQYKWQGEPSESALKDMILKFEQDNKCMVRILKGSVRPVENKVEENSDGEPNDE